MNYRRIGQKTDIAGCLSARDYKGFSTGHQLETGVIVRGPHDE